MAFIIDVPLLPYLLGLLAMIKCSICSYQCDNWYVSNWRLACHINFYLGRCPLELAQGPSRVALAWHKAGGCTPFGVTFLVCIVWGKLSGSRRRASTGLWFQCVSGSFTWNKNAAVIRLRTRALLSMAYFVSQRSLHNAPIFRLLLKVAVNGTHQCDFQNFWGTLGSQLMLFMWHLADHCGECASQAAAAHYKT